MHLTSSLMMLCGKHQAIKILFSYFNCFFSKNGYKQALDMKFCFELFWQVCPRPTSEDQGFVQLTVDLSKSGPL